MDYTDVFSSSKLVTENVSSSLRHQSFSGDTADPIVPLSTQVNVILDYYIACDLTHHSASP